MMAARPYTSIRRLLKALRRDCSGLALIEFAYTLPIMLVLITGGAELANYSVTTMRLSALALQVADNASRIGEGDPLSSKKISEAQINDLLQGALAQGGRMNLNGTYAEKRADGSSVVKNKARIIISSLEPDTSHPGKDYIHWQRCYGQATEYTPQYGVALDDDLAGMGPAGRQAYAPEGTAVIFVEVYFRYEPLFPVLQSNRFGVMSYRDMKAIAAMIVRDDRDLSQLYNNEGVAQSTCS
nr:G5 [uncultured bacterium]